MKIKILVSIFFIGILGIAIGYYLFSKKVPSLENTKADFELTADELFNAFDENEAAALAKYEGKVIEVSGEIARINYSEASSTVTLEAANALAGGINCSFKEVVSDIKKGDQVQIKGRCQGFLMDVVLNNCSK